MAMRDEITSLFCVLDVFDYHFPVKMERKHFCLQYFIFSFLKGVGVGTGLTKGGDCLRKGGIASLVIITFYYQYFLFLLATEGMLFNHT